MVCEGYFRINSFSLFSYINVRTKSYDVFVCNTIASKVFSLLHTLSNADRILRCNSAAYYF